MKIVKVDNLKGGEILAKPILTNEYRILLSEEVVLRPEYINKIKELGITDVYIKDQDQNQNQVRTEEVVLLKTELEESFKRKVKNVLEKHTYNNSQELMELAGTADHIIEEILEEDEVVEQIYDIRERSSDIYEHSINLCSLATLTALRLGLTKERVHDIGVGSLLHDLGLRYMTISYQNRNMDELSKIELAEYMKHPVYGYSAVKKENWISPTGKNIILFHHEKKDGSGYPLKAREIPYEAAIVGVCDTFDEMICGIGCKRVKVYEAVEYMKTYRDIHFPKEIVDTLLEFTAVYPAGSKVLLTNGQEGKVIRQNRDFSDRPVVQLKDQTIIDLVKVNHVFIEKVLE